MLRLAAAAAGLAIGAGGLALLWPRPDRALAPQQPRTPAELAKPPTRPVTLLLIGLDAERPDDPLNGAAPRGPANADALLLVRVNPGAPTQVLSLPPQLAVTLPGQSRPLALASLYRLGGAALLGDAVSELVGLETSQPDRYLVLSRSALRQLVDGLGGIEANPPQAMRYRDRSQNFSIDLQAGLQRLQAGQVEQLVRFQDPQRPLESRFEAQREAVRALVRALALPSQLAQLPALLESLSRAVVTNVSQSEALGLLAAGLGQGGAVEFSTVPLTPARASQAPLRQLSPNAVLPLWPAAQPGTPPGGAGVPARSAAP